MGKRVKKLEKEHAGNIGDRLHMLEEQNIAAIMILQDSIIKYANQTTSGIIEIQ